MRLDFVRLFLGILALCVVVAGAVKVLLPFVQSILWALILGSATWPAYRLLRRLLGRRQGIAALLMTVLLVIVVMVPVGFMSIAMLREIEPAVVAVHNWSQQEKVELPPAVKVVVEKVPGLQGSMKPWMDRLTDKRVREAWLKQFVWPAERIMRWSRNVLRQIVVLSLTVFTLFFVYRDGDKWAHEARLLLDRIAGGQGRHLLAAIRETVRAVFYGWLLTAAVQGLVSMFGYWVAGMHAPILLGIATGIAAVVPFGVGLVWIPAVAILVAGGHWGPAIFLAAWSLGVVSLIDNFIRPLVISGSSNIPFILVFFGVLGGLIAFGAIGLVLGPVFLAILLALWRSSREALADGDDGGDDDELTAPA